MEDTQKYHAANLISLVCYGVDDKWISSACSRELHGLAASALLREKYNIRKDALVTFSPWGTSGSFVIEESHLNYHTYPERRTIDFSLNTCRGVNAGWVTIEYIVKKIDPKDILVRAMGVPLDRTAVKDLNKFDFVFKGEPSDFYTRTEDLVKTCIEEMCSKHML